MLYLYHTSSRGVPITVGITVRGASSPENPAFSENEPLSHTNVLWSTMVLPIVKI